MTDNESKIRKLMFLDMNVIDCIDSRFAPFDFKYRGQAIHVLLIVFFNQSETYRSHYIELAHALIAENKHGLGEFNTLSSDRSHKKAVQMQMSRKLNDETAPFNDNIIVVAALMHSGLIE